MLRFLNLPIIFVISTSLFSCGEEVKTDLKITNGIPVSNDTYPEVVSLGGCTGTFVLSRNGVDVLITAAHCVCGPGGSVKNVFVNGIQSTSVFTPTSYQCGGVATQPSDIAYAYFPSGTTSSRLPICNDLPKKGERVELLGYGNTDNINDVGAGVRRYGTNSVSYVTSSHAHVLGVAITTEQSGINSVTGKGDSGGPLILERNGKKCVGAVVSAGSITGESLFTLPKGMHNLINTIKLVYDHKVESFPNGAEVSASSSMDGFPATYAIDQDTTTRWSSNFREGQSLTIDAFEENREIHQVRIKWEDAFAEDYDIAVAEKDGPFKTVSRVRGSFGGETTHSFFAVGNRVRITSVKKATSWGISIFEVAIVAGDPNSSFMADVGGEIVRPEVPSYPLPNPIANPISNPIPQVYYDVVCLQNTTPNPITIIYNWNGAYESREQLLPFNSINLYTQTNVGGNLVNVGYLSSPLATQLTVQTILPSIETNSKNCSNPRQFYDFGGSIELL